MKNLLMTCLIVLTSACSVVGPGQKGVRVTLGSVSSDVKNSGVYMYIPFITKVNKISVQIQRSDVNTSASSRDMQEVKTTLALNWSIDPTQVIEIVKTLGNENDILERVINPAVNEVLKQATAQRPVEEILSKRTELKSEIDIALATRLKSYGIIIRDVSIVDIHFGEEFTKSIERKQVAEQEAKRAEYDSIRAEQEATATVNRAKGEAESQRLLKSTITSELLELKAIEKWNGVLPQVTSGATPFIQLNK